MKAAARLLEAEYWKVNAKGLLRMSALIFIFNSCKAAWRQNQTLGY